MKTLSRKQSPSCWEGYWFDFLLLTSPEITCVPLESLIENLEKSYTRPV